MPASTRTAPFFLLLAVSACLAPPRPAKPPALVVADSGASSIEELDPPALIGPSDVACTYVTTDLSLSLPLALDGAGPPFAWVHPATGKLAVATGPTTNGAFLEHIAPGARVRGWVQTAFLDLYVTRPFLFSGWLVPRTWTKLRWLSGQTGSLELRLDDDLRDGHQSTVTFHETPRAIVPCADVALRSGETDGGAQLLLRGRKGMPQHVRAGEPIPLARNPGEAPVAVLRFARSDTAAVTVIEQRGRDALVVIDGWEPATIQGWIENTFFARAPGFLEGGLYARAPTVRHRPADERARQRVACAKQVRVAAHVAGRRAWVGEIDAGTSFVFVVDDSRDSYRDVELDTVSVSTSSNARLVAERVALDACTPTTPRR